ncbi:ACT domain-containing protein [Candidatus Microgenomates bacterium]|nr:ACT domain-containing protein [Candidatus Microgenomates bacterium]
MTGQTDLSGVLKSLQVSCDNIEYGFASVKDKQINFDDQVLGTFKENEGLTIIAPREYFETNDIQYEGPYAKLTIEVHTSLELVGLTAILARKLAENQISANVVAGYFHDHIFVQYAVRQKAIEAINNLKEK